MLHGSPTFVLSGSSEVAILYAVCNPTPFLFSSSRCRADFSLPLSLLRGKSTGENYLRLASSRFLFCSVVIMRQTVGS